MKLFKDTYRIEYEPMVIDKVSSISGLILGFLSRPCCVLPFIFSVLGFSSSSLILTLGSYTKLFAATSVVSFGISSYFTFRVKGAVFNKILFVMSVTSSVAFMLAPYL